MAADPPRLRPTLARHPALERPLATRRIARRPLLRRRGRDRLAKWTHARRDRHATHPRHAPRPLALDDRRRRRRRPNPPSQLAALKLQPPRPGQHAWTPFQEAGEQLARDGCRGILYASAARPDHQALCLFRDNIAIPGAEPIRPPGRTATRRRHPEACARRQHPSRTRITSSAWTSQT